MEVINETLTLSDERKQSLHDYFGPKKYPCMIMIHVLPTNPDLANDGIGKVFYLPDVFRRMLLAISPKFFKFHAEG